MPEEQRPSQADTQTSISPMQPRQYFEVTSQTSPSTPKHIFNSRVIAAELYPDPAAGHIALHIPRSEYYDTAKIIDLQQRLTHIVSPEGNWLANADLQGNNPYHLSPQEIWDNPTIAQTFEDIYALVNFRCSEAPGYVGGYNNHDLPHIKRTEQRAHNLLPDSQDNRIALNLVTWAVLAHDIGMLQNIEHHQVISADMLAQIVPELANSIKPEEQRYWEIIKKAIDLHDSSADLQHLDVYGLKAADYFRYWTTQQEPTAFAMDNPSAEQQAAQNDFRKFAQDSLFQKVFCALFLADKLDVGPSRIGLSVLYPEALEEDYHLSRDLLGRTTSAKKEGNEFVWRLAFRPDFTSEEEDMHEGSLQALDTFRQKETPEAWWKVFYDKTHERNKKIYLMAAAAFILDPSLGAFKIDVRNVSLQAKVTPKDVQTQLENI